ncbi:decapping and exoribonuclease protein [Nasonia vitripennis]|uniref:Decapping nuclease n=1 Tax=Nasonia vitripennis TaxID=7425 RepID=A0A7M7G6I9_NASVI|nr:decapping and exoribonuclease protein [Nasonia vitripennis]
MSFVIHQYHRNQNFPSFNRPEVVGYFSLNGQEREYSQDLSQLKYYTRNPHSKQEVDFDLNEGLDQVIRKPANLDEKLDHILRWIVNNYRTIRASPELNRWLRPEFVCFRGLLTKIVCTPFENRDGWIICAMKFHGTIYLFAFDTEEQKCKNANLTKKDLQFMSWGFKFEQYVLSDSPGSSPKTDEPVNEAEEFCCLFSTKLGHKTLLYGAEMDGVCSRDVVREPVNWKYLKFVELKTNRVIKNSYQEQNYRRKLLKWWCQSFLVGIDEVIYGTRTDQGKVFELDNVKVTEMPKIARAFWNASECMNFCNDFLNHVRTVVTREYKECVYKFEYKLGETIEMQVLPSTSEFSFLPDWYIDQANRIIQTSQLNIGVQ